jgi:hypothetical protein
MRSRSQVIYTVLADVERDTVYVSGFMLIHDWHNLLTEKILTGFGGLFFFKGLCGGSRVGRSALGYISLTNDSWHIIDAFTYFWVYLTVLILAQTNLRYSKWGRQCGLILDCLCSHLNNWEKYRRTSVRKVKSPGRVLNPGSHDYKAGMLSGRSRRYVAHRVKMWLRVT